MAWLERRVVSDLEGSGAWLDRYDTAGHPWAEATPLRFPPSRTVHAYRRYAVVGPQKSSVMAVHTDRMGVRPAIVAELNQINAKMHVITGTLDSTMGRAGRMMPWMPFSP